MFGPGLVNGIAKNISTPLGLWDTIGVSLIFQRRTVYAHLPKFMAAPYPISTKIGEIVGGFGINIAVMIKSVLMFYENCKWI